MAGATAVLVFVLVVLVALVAVVVMNLVVRLL